jgi:GTP-binding protein Era
MNRGVRQALAEVDVVLFVVEAGRFDDRDRAVRKLLPDGCPVIIVVNKIDQLQGQDAAAAVSGTQLAGEGEFAAIVPVSAMRGAQLDACSPKTRKHLPNDELLFGEDEITDRSERFLAAEYIREKLFRLIGDELPYAAPSRSRSSSSTVRCAASARRFSSIARDTSRSSLARAAKIIKRIASEARQDMERMFDGRFSGSLCQGQVGLGR